MTRTVALLIALVPLALAAQEPDKRKPALVGVQIAQARTDAPIVVRVVLPDGPAMKAGLKEGDHIVRIDGVKPRDLATAVRVIRALTPGKKAKFLIERDSKEKTIEVTPIAVDG